MIKVDIFDDGNIIAYDNTIADSIMFEKIRFNFPDAWNGYDKTAVFRNGETKISVVLNSDSTLCTRENECYVPFEVIKAPYFTVSVFGVSGESRATTPQVRINVFESGYGEGDVPSEPTPTQYEQLISLANATKQIAQSVRDDADNGLFVGEKGDKGDPGEVTTAYANNTFANSLKGSKSGSAILIDDVSPVTHDMSVKISSDTVEDLMAVKVKKYGKNLFNKEAEKHNIILNSGTIKSNTGYKTIFIDITGISDFVISNPSTQNVYYGICDSIEEGSTIYDYN